MMTISDRELKHYFRVIASWLPCSHKQKKQIVNSVRDSVGNYLASAPDADISQIVTRFGEPQAIAAAYVDNTNTSELLRQLRIRRRVVSRVTALVIAALLLWVCLLTWAAHKERAFLSESHGILITDTYSNNETYIPIKEKGELP